MKKQTKQPALSDLPSNLGGDSRKTSFEERVIKSAVLRIQEEKGVCSKPSEIRAILRDPRFYITKRGAVKKVESNKK